MPDQPTCPRFYFFLSLSEQPVVPRFSVARRLTQFDLFVCESHCFLFFFPTSWCAFNISLSGKSPASPCNNFLKRQPPSVRPPALHLTLTLCSPPRNRLKWIIADWILLVRLYLSICSHFRRFEEQADLFSVTCRLIYWKSSGRSGCCVASLSDEGASMSCDWWPQSVVMNKISLYSHHSKLGYLGVSLFCDIFKLFMSPWKITQHIAFYSCTRIPAPIPPYP